MNRIVERLTAGDREAAIDVLATSFREYPVMRYVIGKKTPDYDTKLRALIGFYCDKRFVNKWPVLGIRNHDQQLVAIAVVSEPISGPSADLSLLKQNLFKALGKEARLRMEGFEQQSDINEPTGPHYFVGMLGVSTGHQGMGYGKALLLKVRELAVKAGSAGVCLTTEDPANVPLYEHLGFHELAQAKLGDFRTWCLVWPNPEYAP